MIRKLLTTAFLFFLMSGSQLFAAEDFTLWSSQTFTSFTGGVVATSAEITNPSSFNSLKIFITYEDVEPDTCQCQITAVVEEELTTDIWVPIAVQHNIFGQEGSTPKRLLILSPQFVANPGTDIIVITPGGDIAISDTHGVAPATFRVRILVKSFTQLTSLKLSAIGRKFNE